VGSSAEEFSTLGFLHIPPIFSALECESTLENTHGLLTLAAGTRKLIQEAWCHNLAMTLRCNAKIAAILPHDYVAVQCTYFEKSLDRNWLVPIHQDLSIPVAQRIEQAELSGWSEKEGELFVQPPAWVLERLVALRLHLDPCSEHDGALSFVPGTHTLGRLSLDASIALRAERGAVVCPVPLGGVFAMRPLLLHASSRATGTSRRRVLHFLFGPPQLPFGLRWR
jgi:ectoine hydroxylase-related dioxygenase (phytanoyl-CoA dioxygenase family)